MTRTLQELLGALEDSDPRVRYTAANALGQMHVLARAVTAVSALAKALNDQDEAVRYCAVKALWRIGPAAEVPALVEVAVPALAEALNNRDGVVRYWAARALGKIGPDAVAAVPALRAALKDSDVDVCLASKWALGEIEGV